MIGEMKREALQSLRGKWGLGVGSTLLYGILSYILSLFATLIVIIPFVLLFMLLGDSIDLFEGETVTIGFTVTFVILYGLMMFMSLMSYGITAYGYTNVFLNISRRKGATIDALFEGFRGFRRMMNAAKAMILIFYILEYGFLSCY
ncbi:hypothetical protein [Bacillus pseudomycoides]|uniref:hypothetical protein n=1 Tax=Bacillus pseudomycoides TaxID=64104 RepID=UPI00352B3378